MLEEKEHESVEILSEDHIVEKKPKKLFGLVFIIVTASVLFFFYFSELGEPPKNFPAQKDIEIVKGMPVQNIADMLHSQNIITSPLYFKIILKTQFNDVFIQAGSYRFDEPLSTIEIARALTNGDHQTPPLKITFPEGFRVADIHKYLPEEYKRYDVDSLVEREGYLFPDTYFFETDTTIEEILLTMQTTFNQKLDPFKEEISQSSFTLSEIIILASILEREAKDPESMKIVAGILIDRLDLGMALQVDATFEYILGRGSADLTLEDLKVESPYNTYTNRGLPPAPISNPGLIAIEAVLRPIKTEYLYYLTADDGQFHYAQTFEQHKQNKFKYLR